MHLFKNTFFYRTSQVTASDSSRFPACSFIEKETWARMFIVNFAKSLRTSFVRTPPDDCFLCLSVNLKSFSDHLFYRTFTSCRISATTYSKQVFHMCFIQAFYTRRSSYLKGFMYLKSLKVIANQCHFSSC